MSKKTILTKRPKKLIALILVCLITIALTGCDSADKKPTGGLPLGDTYASATVGDKTFTVTVGSVYDKLRYNAVSYVEDRVYNILFANEIETVKTDVAPSNEDSKYRTQLEEIILEDIYGTSDNEEIEKLYDKKVKELNYVDKMFQKGYIIDANTFFNDNANFKAVYENYYLEVAKYVAAEEKLSKEFTKDADGNFTTPTDDSYFTKKEVINYYKNNYENTGDVTALLVRFLSQTEANKILAKFGLKSSGGKWYQIKLDDQNPTAWDTDAKYQEYYEDYKLNLTGGAAPINVLGNGEATVLKVLAAIYNSVYGKYRPLLELDPANSYETFFKNYSGDEYLAHYRYVESIISKDAETAEDLNNTELTDIYSRLTAYEEANNETIVMSKERLDKYSSSLTDYVCNTLKTKDEADKEELKTYTQYNTAAKKLGNYYYLIFKVKQDKIEQEIDKDLYNEEEDTFTNTTFLNEILNEMFKEELTDTYVENAFKERVKEAKVKIFDSIIEAQLMYNSTSVLAESYGKNKTKNNDNNQIAEVTYKGNTEKIFVKDLFSFLEPVYGTQVAQNLLFQQYIKGTDYYINLQGDYDKYVETIKLMLYYFANDYYASSGFPSTIGKYNFMMLYYGTADIDTVVRDFLMVSDATNAFFVDFAEHGFAGDKFYEEVAKIAEIDYKNFKSVTVSGLTVYADLDEDGIADADSLDGDLLTEAKNLLDAAYSVVKNSNEAYLTTLNNIVKEYNDSTRIADSNPTTPEHLWAHYRSLGLHLEVTSFGTITNTTTEIDSNVKERALALYDKVVDKDLGFTSNYIDDSAERFVATRDHKLTRLVVTGGAKATSAKFEAKDEDETKLYSQINVIVNGAQKVIDVTYTDDMFNKEQVEAYIAEYILLGDVYSLPSTTNLALDEYILPYISKYVGQASQMNIIQNVLGEITFNETLEVSTLYTADFVTLYKSTEFGRKGFLNKYIEIIENVEDNYDERYDKWWNTMYINEGGKQ